MGFLQCVCCTSFSKIGINFVSCCMQGKKEYQEKLFAQFQLSDHVPKGNFYRRLKETLDLHFLYVLHAHIMGIADKKVSTP